MLQFEPGRTPSAPKDAATVVLVREIESRNIEIFCVKRHQASGFLGGAVVFPGGKVSPEDAVNEWKPLVTALRGRALAVAPDENIARAFAVAALRELFEEAQILLSAGDELDDERAAALRSELKSRAQSGSDDAALFRSLCLEKNLLLDVSRLEALWRWVTPEQEARRYDTRFYVAAAPSRQGGAHDEHETTSSFWATPAAILERWEQCEIFLAPPTLRTVQVFAPARTIDECFAIASAQSLEPVCPHFVMDGELAMLALPGDPLYPRTAPPPLDPRAPTRFVMKDGRFVPERAA